MNIYSVIDKRSKKYKWKVTTVTLSAEQNPWHCNLSWPVNTMF